MHKIDTDTAVDGEFTDGDGTVENPATDLNAAWFNSVQDELVNVLEGMGIALDDQDNAQLWAALQKIGIACVYLPDSNENLNVEDFAGSCVVFRKATDFSITGTLNSGSLFVVIPLWNDLSTNYIDITYGTYVVRVKKWNIFLGCIGAQQAIAGVNVPMLSTFGVLNIEAVKSAKWYGSVEIFHYSSTIVDGVEEWRAWQLASKWDIGQVKRVRCDNSLPNLGMAVNVGIDLSGTQKAISFYDYSYVEFLCIGTYEEDDVEYAVLLVNGKN